MEDPKSIAKRHHCEGTLVPEAISLRSLLTMTRVILAIVLISFTAGCGQKEPPKTDTVEGTGAGKGGGTEKQKGQADGVEHKILSFDLEGMTEKGEKKWEVMGSTARSISENEVRLGNIIAKTYGDEEAVIVARP